MRKCAENYSFISDDLVNHCTSGPTRDALALLLKYYSRGLRRALISVPDDDSYFSMKNDIKDRLNEIDVDLLACEVEVPSLPERNGETFEIPNASIIELLVRSYFGKFRFPQPYTLSELGLLQLVQLYQLLLTLGIDHIKTLLRSLNVWGKLNALDQSGMSLFHFKSSFVDGEVPRFKSIEPSWLAVYDFSNIVLFGPFTLTLSEFFQVRKAFQFQSLTSLSDTLLGCRIFFFPAFLMHHAC